MMKDYLFKFGNYIFPMKYIESSGFDAKPNQRQDLDPYTDQFGVTQRNALHHTKTGIEIKTMPIPWNEMETIMRNIVANYISYGERDAICEYFDMESQTWKTGHFYLDPSVKFNVEEFGKTYGEMTWVFTEY